MVLYFKPFYSSLSLNFVHFLERRRGEGGGGKGEEGREKQETYRGKGQVNMWGAHCAAPRAVGAQMPFTLTVTPSRWPHSLDATEDRLLWAECGRHPAGWGQGPLSVLSLTGLLSP